MDNPELLTVKEVADALLVDPTCVRRWIKQGILDAITLPSSGDDWHTYRIRRSTLDAILNTPAASQLPR